MTWALLMEQKQNCVSQVHFLVVLIKEEKKEEWEQEKQSGTQIFFFVPRSCHVDELKIYHLFSLSRSLVSRAPARCVGGHGFDSCLGLRFIFCPARVPTPVSYPRSCHVHQFTFHSRILFSILTTGKKSRLPFFHFLLLYSSSWPPKGLSCRQSLYARPI